MDTNTVHNVSKMSWVPLLTLKITICIFTALSESSVTLSHSSSIISVTHSTCGVLCTVVGGVCAAASTIVAVDIAKFRS